MSCGQMSQECTAGIQGLQGWLVLCEASVLHSDWQKASEKGLFIHLCCINAQHAMPERIQMKSFYQRTSSLVMQSM